MHELAISEAIVAALAERFSGEKVTRVILEIGALAAVLPDAIRFSFTLCAAGTPAEGATLEVIEVPAQGRCRSCGLACVVKALVTACSCGSSDVEIQSGQHLLIRAVEVA